jgi:DNA-binding response OmpR family regulator
MKQNKKILICDDDEGILDMLELILEDNGYTIIPEKNSLNIKSTIELQQPDLVLLDLWMPVLSGDQIVKSLRDNKSTEKLPVIIISASRDGKQIAEDSGASGFIAKPFDFDELIRMIEGYLN